MESLKIRNVIVGEGEPKICVPIVAENIEEIREQAMDIAAGDLPTDLIELRIDYLSQYDDVDYIHNAITQLKECVDKPIILTFRTGYEGGVRDIARADYTKLLVNILQDSLVDIVDVELFTGDDFVSQIIQKAHVCHIKVIMSNHDFHQTPDNEELLYRLQKMDELGADIVKLAVMPQSSSDVLRLLSVTDKAKAILDKPVVTMSMSGMGLISRLSGELFGSAITFGAAKEASAPGQIEVTELKRVLSLIHRNAL